MHDVWRKRMLTKLFQSVENVKIMVVENHAMLFVYKKGSSVHFMNIFNQFASRTARGAGTCLIRRICENPAPDTFSLRLSWGRNSVRAGFVVTSPCCAS